MLTTLALFLWGWTRKLFHIEDVRGPRIVKPAANAKLLLEISRAVATTQPYMPIPPPTREGNPTPLRFSERPH